jgi:phospholipid-binding lipoprotein MlaA|tara:strand:- start:704 stop:1501 length:798 start_codon:yes stop_codon:yes gene_type:complete
MKNLFKAFFILIFIFSSNPAFAGSDGNIELTKKNKKNQTTEDCFESINRASFAFNQGLDKVIFKPIAKGYRKLPSPVRNGTSNVLDNLSNLITIPNNVLQGDLKEAGTNSARLVINTTLGIFGIFDIADVLGFPEYQKEDYGQTLGSWGLGHGCYLVLPVLGPSTVRDTAGMFVNVMGGDPYYRISVNGNNEYLDGELYAATKMLSGIDFRAKNLESLDNLEENSMDFYASVKSLYLQDRERKIANSKINLEDMDESDWEEIETK